METSHSPMRAARSPHVVHVLILVAHLHEREDLILSAHSSGSPGVYPARIHEYCLLVAAISDGFSRRSKASIQPILQSTKSFDARNSPAFSPLAPELQE